MYIARARWSPGSVDANYSMYLMVDFISHFPRNLNVPAVVKLGCWADRLIVLCTGQVILNTNSTISLAAFIRWWLDSVKLIFNKPEQLSVHESWGTLQGFVTNLIKRSTCPLGTESARGWAWAYYYCSCCRNYEASSSVYKLADISAFGTIRIFGVKAWFKNDASNAVLIWHSDRGQSRSMWFLGVIEGL